MASHNRLHNPNYSGPGIWFNMHTNCAWATTPDQKRFTIDQIKNLQSKFPCGECKVHFGNYIQAHPMEPTINGNEEALFLWSFNFHNAVNARLRKPQFSYEDAKKIYYDDASFCSANCDEEKSKTPPKLRPKDLPGYIF